MVRGPWSGGVTGHLTSKVHSIISQFAGTQSESFEGEVGGGPGFEIPQKFGRSDAQISRKSILRVFRPYVRK